MGISRVLAACALMTACASAGRVQAGAETNGAPMMTDANVAAVVHASNMDEIQTSQVALQRSQNAQVRQFAQQMVTEHQAFDRQMQELLQARGMAMQPSEPAQAAMQATSATVANLSRRTGMDFDRAYMMHQVQAHRWTLASLDRTLIPSTRDAEVKAFLTTRMRPAVAMHLEAAERMHASMGGSNP